MKTAVVVFLLLAPCAFADAAPPLDGTLSLDQAIQEAEAHSPDLQSAQAAYDQSRWHKLEALGQGFLPKITASGVHYMAAKYSALDITLGGTTFNFPSIYPDTTASIDVMMPIFDGLANVNALKAASLQQDASYNDLSRTQFVLDRQTELVFYEALAASEIEGVAEENVKTLLDHLNLTHVERHSGTATDYDVLRVEVQLSEAQSDLIDAQDAVATSRRKLNQVMGLESDGRALVGNLPNPDANRVTNLVLDDQVIKNRADLAALAEQSDAADKLAGSQSVWWVPQLGLGADYTWYDLTAFNTATNAFTYTGQYQTSYNVGFYLKWNLFDGGVSIAKSREAVYQQVQAQMAQEKAQLQLPYDFDYWKRQYLSNSARYLAKKLDLQRSEESVRLAREGERAGTRTSTEVLDAEVDLFRSRAGVVNAQSNAAQAQIQLELALERSI